MSRCLCLKTTISLLETTMIKHALWLLLLSFSIVHADEVKIAVSANFLSTAQTLIPLFEQQTGHKILLSPGSTGKLFAQLANGAPMDIFLAADQLRPSLLEKQGYTVKEKAEVKGRSGADHSMDILATRDEGIITHRIAIGVEVGKKPMGLAKVFDFDDKAYDAGILDKVFIAVPGLTREARQFAKRQGIRVFEVE